jgi:hypothetical protein
MNLNKLFFIFLLSFNSVFGQDIGTTEVKVLEGFRSQIPVASRLNENATFADTIKEDRVQFFEIVDQNLKSDYKTKPLAVAKVKDDKIPELYGMQIRLGFGSAFTTKADVVYNSKRSRKLTYGFIANHFSNKYYLAKNSKNNMHLFAKKIGLSHTFLANLDYQRTTAFYYDDKTNLESDRFYKNRFAYTKLSFSAISKQANEQKLKHYTNLFVSDLNELSENQIHLSSNLSKTINGMPYSLAIEFNNYLRYNNLESEFKNTDFKIFSVSPAASFLKYDLDLDLGFDLYLASDDLQVALFPKLKATKELVKDVLLIYGGLDHSQKQHTLKSLSDENPYIHSFGINQSILGDSSFLQELEVTDIQELYLGIRNVLGNGEILKASIAYGVVKNLPHFVLVDYKSYNRFRVLYFDEDVKQLHANVSYSKEINNIISLHATADYFSWDVDVYHRSNLTANLNTKINLRNKIKIIPSINYIGKRLVMNDDISEIPAKIHANISLTYVYSKQLSAYLQLNNLTNSTEDLWIGYREIGLNGIFGVKFSF